MSDKKPGQHPQKTLVTLDLDQLDEVRGGVATFNINTIRYVPASHVVSVWQVNPSIRVWQVNPI